MTLRFEAWTFPWSATFRRKVADLPVKVGSASGTVSHSDTHEVTLRLPADYDRLSEVISDTEGSLIRVFDGTTVIDEVIVDRMPRNVGEGEVELSGGDIASVFARTVVYPYDWPKPESTQPDWQWGGDNLIDVSGFEDGPNFITNFGFEDGSTRPFWAGLVEGTSATIAIESSIVDTGSFALRCTAILTEGGCTTEVFGMVPGKVYTVTARVRAPVGQAMQLGCSGPSTLGQGTADRIAEVSDAQSGWEAQKDFTGTGAYQTVTFNFVAANDAVSARNNSARRTEISIRTLSGTNVDFYVDEVTFTGMGAGVGAYDPWFYSTRNEYVTEWIASADFAHSGTYSCKLACLGVPGGTYPTQGIAAKVSGIKSNQTYTMSAWLRTGSGTANWGLRAIHGHYEVIHTVTATVGTTWTKLEATFVTPAIADGRLEVWIVNLTGLGTPSTVYIDDVVLSEGFAPDYPGVFINAFMDDAAVDHAADPRGTPLDWIDYSTVGATTDSDGTNWPEQHSFYGHRGASYLQLWDRLADLGYEWRLVPKTTPVGALTHDLQWYVPGGLGSLLDAASSPTLTIGQSVVEGTVVRRTPPYGRILIEGADQRFTEVQDAGILANFGPFETYVGDTGLADTASRTRTATAMFDAELANRTAVRATVIASPDHPRPLVAYGPGDSVYFQLPPVLAKALRRVQQVSWTNTVPTRYEVTGSKLFQGEAAAYEAIKRILRRFNPLDEKVKIPPSPPAPESPSETIPWLVASFDAPASIKSKAAYVCDGVADQVEIQKALDDLNAFGVGSEVWLSKGTFNIDELSGAPTINIPNNASLIGAGVDATQLFWNNSTGAGTCMIAAGNNTRVAHFSADWSGYDTPLIRIANKGNVTIDWLELVAGDAPIVDLVTVALNIRIRNCYMFNNGAGDHAIRSNNCVSRNIWITDNQLVNGGVGFTGTSSFGRAWIERNYIQTTAAEGVLVDGSASGGLGFFWIARNILASTGTLGGSNRAAIKVLGPTGGSEPIVPPSGTEEYGVFVLNNLIEAGVLIHGIWINDAEAVRVDGNYIEEAPLHGIYLQDADLCQVTDNTIVFVGTATDNTYDGIHADADSNRNTIRGNVIRTKVTSPRHRYGVRINSADCDDNIVVANDLRDSGGTANYSDAGTGTLNTFPGGAIGDNFG